MDYSNIEKSARLSKLEFDDSEKQALFHSIEAVTAFAKSFDALDFSQINDLTHTSANLNVLRADNTAPSFDTNTLLSNAASYSDGFISVPKVVE